MAWGEVLLALFAAGTAGFCLAAHDAIETGQDVVATNVALHKSASTDSVYDDRYPPHNAVDGDHVHVESRWLSSRTNTLDWSAKPHWIEIDLGRPCTVTGMRFWSGAHGEYKWQPADFVFQAFDNGTWIDVITETGNSQAVYGRDFAPVVTDRVRLLATRGTDIGALRLYEIEVIGY